MTFLFRRYLRNTQQRYCRYSEERRGGLASCKPAKIDKKYLKLK
nr:MAG TPA: hypothetical protein [Caudoviricetes sp.]